MAALLDTVPTLATVLIGLAMGAALVVFVVGVGIEIHRREGR